MVIKKNDMLFLNNLNRFSVQDGLSDHIKRREVKKGAMNILN
ncbi:hypothetical protein Cabys_2696 [Caldithrix abyssi DSM 13497]|uniref:Uncharacterized protein n=1 Tax=Caldithrix abyssi DSM 13497 TaxID=880073 RepID=A0A1J1CAM2_CALAY|nr:hypothetical protein Cabys_2696 [Caldithrix abyssi DSM 13497]